MNPLLGGHRVPVGYICCRFGDRYFIMCLKMETVRISETSAIGLQATTTRYRYPETGSKLAVKT